MGWDDRLAGRRGKAGGRGGRWAASKEALTASDGPGGLHCGDNTSEIMPWKPSKKGGNLVSLPFAASRVLRAFALRARTDGRCESQKTSVSQGEGMERSRHGVIRESNAVSCP